MKETELDPESEEIKRGWIAYGVTLSVPALWLAYDNDLERKD
jgi:hypothetical protein